MTYKIYKIRNTINEKLYVGQTNETLEQRFKRHMGYQSRENDTKFYRAVRKYGRENFYIEQIEEVATREEATDKESYWIDKLDTIEHGYNTINNKIVSGGDTLTNHPEIDKIREKISQSKLGIQNPSHTEVVCYNTMTGEIRVFYTIKQCMEYFNEKHPSFASKRCNNTIKKKYLNVWIIKYLK